MSQIDIVQFVLIALLWIVVAVIMHVTGALATATREFAQEVNEVFDNLLRRPKL